MLKIEKWNGHEIRFVWHNEEWWAVAKDVADALGYKHTPHMIRMLREDQKDVHLVDTPGGKQEVTIISETGVYKCIMRSKRPEAEEFEQWVYKILKKLREQIGLEGFQIFRMLDKEHQKKAMERLSKARDVEKVDYIKANVIANKIISDKYGFDKMVKKDEMTPNMLLDRQPVLDDVVTLMKVNKDFNLGIPVSKKVRQKWLKAN